MLALDRHLLASVGSKERALWAALSGLAAVNVLLSGVGIAYFGWLVFRTPVALSIGLLWALVFSNLQTFVFHMQEGRSLRFGTFVTLIVKTGVMGFLAFLAALPLVFALWGPSDAELGALRAERIEALHEAHEQRRADALAEIEQESSRLEWALDTRRNAVQTLRRGLVAAEAGERLRLRQLEAAEADLREFEARAEARLAELRRAETAAMEADRREASLIDQHFDEDIFVIAAFRSVFDTHRTEAECAVAVLVLLFNLPFWSRRLFWRRSAYLRGQTALEAELRERARADFSERYRSIVREEWGVQDYVVPERWVPTDTP